MNALTFDTLAYARRLEAAGFSRVQSETLAEELARVLDERLATKADIAAIQADIEALRLSTKADIEALRLNTKADIDGLRLSTKGDLAETKADILKWMAGMIFGAVLLNAMTVVGAMLAMVRLFAH